MACRTALWQRSALGACRVAGASALRPLHLGAHCYQRATRLACSAGSHGVSAHAAQHRSVLRLASLHTAPLLPSPASPELAIKTTGTGDSPATSDSNPLTTVVLDGKATADTICEEMRQLILRYQSTQHTTDKPGLAVIIAGDRRDSLRYVSRKTEQADKVGFHSRLLHFPESVTTEELLTAIEELNADEKVHGVLVQLPLPEQVEQHKVLERVSIEKDVDGFHPYNMGLLALNWEGAGKFVPWAKVHDAIEKSVDEQDAVVEDTSKLFNMPCAPRACLELMKRYGINVRGKHCVVLGRSAIVGLPLSLLLLHAQATVTNCHHLTPPQQQKALCQQADVIVSATGQPQLVRRDWVKRGAVVLDVGINFIRKRDGGAVGGDEDERDGVQLVGDVDTEGMMGQAAAVTPVPGGVGPMTVAMLLENTLHNWIRAKGGDKQKGAEHNKSAEG